MNLPEPPLLSEAGNRALTAAVPGGSRPQGKESGTASDLEFPSSGSQDQGTAERAGLYFDVAALLDGTLPEPPAPVVLQRSDGVALFYEGQVNSLFGDPESGKTWIALVAVSSTLCKGLNALVIDIDHNGPEATIGRLLQLGTPVDALRERFRYVEPEDNRHLRNVVADAPNWTPDVVVVDSVGELLPLFGASSNSPDDFTTVNTNVLKPLAMSCACVITVDHLAKNTESRLAGATGTAAKRRAIGGTSLRVTLHEQFTPDGNGASILTISKDRHGGLRRHCPKPDSKGEQAAGVFQMRSMGTSDGRSTVEVKPPDGIASSEIVAAVNRVSRADIDALSALDSPPENVRDVQQRMKWGGTRATNVLRAWREMAHDDESEERP